jgi:hypothetical protein
MKSAENKNKNKNLFGRSQQSHKSEEAKEGFFDDELELVS